MMTKQLFIRIHKQLNEAGRKEEGLHKYYREEKSLFWQVPRGIVTLPPDFVNLLCHQSCLVQCFYEFSKYIVISVPYTTNSHNLYTS